MGSHLLIRTGAAAALALALSAVAACSGSFTASDGAGGAGGSSAGASTAGSSSSAGKPSAGESSSAGASSSGGAAAGGAGASAGSAGSGAGDSGTAGSAGTTSSECPCAAPRPTCVAGHCVSRGPQMIKAGSFFIDRTEVTVDQYTAFTRAKGDDTSGQAMECAWNDSFDPAYPPGVAAGKDHPVTFVDFCDAAAYCAWADKQLCGRIGGGELKLEDSTVPDKGQWIAACGGPDGHLYPYGKDPRPGACNDGNASAMGLIDAGSLASCEGDPRGLFDMLGNAQEWINACDAHNGKLDGCERFGGSYVEAKACSQSGLAMRQLRAAELGFRCCSK